jgi:hypothetical protein
MIITVAFDVKNYVEVMEGWPIQLDNVTFTLERQNNVLKRVCLSFSKLGVEHAPSVNVDGFAGVDANIRITGGQFAELARIRLMNWQAIMSGLQIVDFDFDNYELRYAAESVDEESHIHISSFKSQKDERLNSACDFEQFGRAFCAGVVPDTRIESTTHFREGRIAYGAERYVDAYNNMFLFLETRFCDGKTKTEQQIKLLTAQSNLCKSLEQKTIEFLRQNTTVMLDENKFDLFQASTPIRDKVKLLVQLRGKLRHHSLKSPHRWNPNRQQEFKSAARFLGAVVGDIVIEESINEIYAPVAVEKFKTLSKSAGCETTISLLTYRLQKKPTLALDMIYPTTVVSSKLCLSALQSALEECQKTRQLIDTVRLEGSHEKTKLELFTLELGVWAYTDSRAIVFEHPIGLVQCSFEHFESDTIVRHEFSIPFSSNRLDIPSVWIVLKNCFDHIEKVDPTTRLMNLKLFLNGIAKPILTYRVGPYVKN